MNANFEVTIPNLVELQNAFRQFPKISAPILAKALMATQFIFQKNTLKDDPVPWRTGNLLQSFRFKTSAAQASWSPTAKYAAMVEFGTRPHEIRPVNARALAWMSGGSSGGYRTAASGRQYYRGARGGTMNFAMVVHHPGTRPRPYMEGIVKKSRPEIESLFAQAGDMITREIARTTGSNNFT